MDRYRVTVTRDARKFGILDREAYDYCALVDEDGTVLPLEWQTRNSAEAWLNRCYQLWARWESEGGGSSQGIPPRGWRPAPTDISPFDRGIQFYS
jgi:hypothetical protein